MRPAAPLLPVSPQIGACNPSAPQTRPSQSSTCLAVFAIHMQPLHPSASSLTVKHLPCSVCRTPLPAPSYWLPLQRTEPPPCDNSPKSPGVPVPVAPRTYLRVLPLVLRPPLLSSHYPCNNTSPLPVTTLLFRQGRTFQCFP